MSSLDNAREDARAVLRQRVKVKTDKICEEHTELRTRNRVDSEPTAGDVSTEESFAPDDPVDMLKIVCVVGVVLLVCYFFLL